MHLIFQNDRRDGVGVGEKGGARKIVVKNLVVDQKILILKGGCIMEQLNILKELQGVFGENRKVYNCSTIN